MPKLFLHVGFHKTGTTSLQYALNLNRSELHSQGLIYPKTRKFMAQHEFAWSLGNRGWGWKQFGGGLTGPAPARRMFRLIRSSKKSLIVSSEFLTDLTTEKIEKLLSSIGDKELQVIFTIRPVAKILPSAYQQEVKNGSKLTFDKWLERVLEPEKENRNKTRFWTRHSHHITIAKWISVVGKDRISVIVSDDSKPDFLTKSFLKLVGADTSHFRESANPVVNRSMDMAEIELLRRINAKFDRNLGWDEYLASIRSTLVKAWTQSPPAENSPGKLSNPKIWEHRINQKVQEVAEGVKNLDVEIIGDVDLLSHVEFGSNSIPNQIDLDDLVGPILARTRQSVLDSFKARDLLRLALSRLLKNLKREIKQILGMKQKAI